MLKDQWIPAKANLMVCEQRFTLSKEQIIVKQPEIRLNYEWLKMRHVVDVVAIAILILVGTTNANCSDALTGDVTVILKGEGDSERAPHIHGNVRALDVIRDGTVFRMWYGGQGRAGQGRIFCAESPDGQKWFRKGVVVRDDLANHVNDPSVVVVISSFAVVYDVAY